MTCCSRLTSPSSREDFQCSSPRLTATVGCDLIGRSGGGGARGGRGRGREAAAVAGGGGGGGAVLGGLPLLSPLKISRVDASLPNIARGAPLLRTSGPHCFSPGPIALVPFENIPLNPTAEYSAYIVGSRQHRSSGVTRGSSRPVIRRARRQIRICPSRGSSSPSQHPSNMGGGSDYAALKREGQRKELMKLLPLVHSRLQAASYTSIGQDWEMLFDSVRDRARNRSINRTQSTAPRRTTRCALLPPLLPLSAHSPA